MKIFLALLTAVATFGISNFAQAGKLKAFHSEKCAEILNASTAQGAPAVQANCHTGISQDWYFVSAGGGYDYIVSSQSNKCLAVLNGSVAQGAQVVLAQCAPNPWYKWQIIPNNDLNATRTIKAAHSGMCMAVFNGSTGHGAYIVQATCTGDTFHRWYTP